MCTLPPEDQIDVLAYRETQIAMDKIKTAANTRARAGDATLDDLRVLSVGPMSEGSFLHASLLMRPKKDGDGSHRKPKQTSGAQQLAKLVGQRDGPNASHWAKILRGGR